MKKDRKAAGGQSAALNFEQLVQSIQGVHKELTAEAKRAVNVSLTLRNWLIGCYIAEYELHGEDKAVYGERLLAHLSQQLMLMQVSNCHRRQLYSYMRFYRTYPQIVWTLSTQSQALLPPGLAFDPAGVQTAMQIEPNLLVTRFSYSMLVLLVDIGDEHQRAFYESECLRGGWSVRELKRQIASLYYERTALSQDRMALAEITQEKAEKDAPYLEIRDPYIFEFLGLKPVEVMGESHLEDQLLDKLQDLLLELGHGFCFEARQKRILIGESHGFVDLVFYHRILKCHILIELKLEEFSHQNIGQLNTYVSWYRKHMMEEGDSAPIGILLCAQKDHAMVEYALAGMDNHLFVSKYQLHLPDRDQLRREIERTLNE